MEAVLRYLEEVDPDAAKEASARYACFGHTGENDQVYGFLTAAGATRSCQEEVVRQLHIHRSTQKIAVLGRLSRARGRKLRSGEFERAWERFMIVEREALPRF
jgi:erythromycin esterase-like protein